MRRLRDLVFAGHNLLETVPLVVPRGLGNIDYLFEVFFVRHLCVKISCAWPIPGARRLLVSSELKRGKLFFVFGKHVVLLQETGSATSVGRERETQRSR